MQNNNEINLTTMSHDTDTLAKLCRLMQRLTQQGRGLYMASSKREEPAYSIIAPGVLLLVREDHEVADLITVVAHLPERL